MQSGISPAAGPAEVSLTASASKVLPHRNWVLSEPASPRQRGLRE